jgi:polyhydroxybutyrate depolymerase
MVPRSRLASRARALTDTLRTHPRRPGRAHLVTAALGVVLLAGAALALPGVAGARSQPAVSDPGYAHLTPPRAGLQGWRATAHAIGVDGLRRGYLVVRPRTPAPEPMPVVVLLHGRNMTPADMLRKAGVLRLRDVVLVAPAGYGRSWNAGDCCAAARRARVDDVAFVSDVVARVLADEPGADPRQVYLVGYSNGGRMAYRMACQRPGLFAAVAAVEAVPMYGCRTIGRPVPLLVIASTGDPLLRLTPDAPPRRIEGSLQPSVAEAVATWRRLDGCTGEPVRRVVGNLTAQAWTTCRGGSRVQLDLYRGGGHAWPVGSRATPGALTEIWSFVHPDPVASPSPTPPHPV